MLLYMIPLISLAIILYILSSLKTVREINHRKNEVGIYAHAKNLIVSAVRGFGNINWDGYNPDSEIKNVYNSIKDAPKYPEGFVAK